MFTGIVEELGTVKKIKKGANSAVFTIRAEKILDDSQQYGYHRKILFRYKNSG